MQSLSGPGEYQASGQVRAGFTLQPRPALQQTNSVAAGGGEGIPAAEMGLQVTREKKRETSESRADHPQISYGPPASCPGRCLGALSGGRVKQFWKILGSMLVGKEENGARHRGWREGPRRWARWGLQGDRSSYYSASPPALEDM